MDESFKLANLTNHEDLLKKISEFEGDLSRKTGQDVILIAYVPKGNK